MSWLRDKVNLKWIIMIFIIGLLYFFANALNFLLLTFIITYLAYTIFVKVLHILPEPLKRPKILLVLMYLLILAIVGTTGYRYLPSAISQLSAIIVQSSSFHIEQYRDMIPEKIYAFILNLDMEGILKDIGSTILDKIGDVSTFLLEAFMALLLSFFFILEIDKIKIFCKSFKTNQTEKVFNQVVLFGNSFLNTFGLAIKVQIMISTVNTVLTVIGLLILGFPNILGLAIMIFFLGLMPVIGVVISLIPLTIIAFQIGGVMYVFYIFVIIMIIHAIESYILNPKLYSITMKLPIFFTFMVLMVGELLFGAWGLVIGIPLFVFIVEMIKGSTDLKPILKK
ncbi:AI-2E family transporter [Ureibacillus chungkukjangi]|uniref:Putative PurR-regulated permease PerM n=1 Tax=Ureibacillus chungkukjangi TaxID=1202712 RepID=A0A318TVH0_9BACL|nr:AI-2E family transporter [Ureibacillus chungkukjangi]MCM3388353.1 AI-2E family transporter [Ureibacillus chungkukjangi]PYF08353.1 putative PurR-regulated permease PerM [Ureibacillus chungkukjangi]